MTSDPIKVCKCALTDELEIVVFTMLSYRININRFNSIPVGYFNEIAQAYINVNTPAIVGVFPTDCVKSFENFVHYVEMVERNQQIFWNSCDKRPIDLRVIDVLTGRNDPIDSIAHEILSYLLNITEEKIEDKVLIEFNAVWARLTAYMRGKRFHSFENKIVKFIP